MTDIRGFIQTVLDTKFQGNVKVFWQLKTGDLTEYIVYTLGSDVNEKFSDNTPFIKNADVTIRYYYDAKKIANTAGRTAIKTKEQDIVSAMESAGFYTSTGMFDGGDIDDIGYFTSIGEFNYARVV